MTGVEEHGSDRLHPLVDESDRERGDEGARITLVEFATFACPEIAPWFCAAGARNEVRTMAVSRARNQGEAPSRRSNSSRATGGEGRGGSHGAGRPGGAAPGLPGSATASERDAWGSLGGGYGEQTTGIAGPRRRARPPTRGGPYAGAGQQGGERGDEQLREDVHKLFTEHGQLDPAALQIEVRDGEVRFTGEVDSDRIKELAEEVAGSVLGVRRVINALRLRPGRVGGHVGGRIGTRGGGRGSVRTGRGT